MYDSLGAKTPTRLGFIIAFIGAVMLSLVPTHSAIWYIILANIILMIGCAFSHVASANFRFELSRNERVS